MRQAAKGKRLRTAVLGLAAVLLTAALPVSAITPTDTPSYAETRLWAFEHQDPAGSRAERGLSSTGIEGYQLASWEPASGYPLVPGGRGGLTRESQKSIRSLERRAAEHREKLDSFRQNPDAFDNQARLRNASSTAMRQKIIKGRIQKLEREIRKFESEIEKIQGSV